MPSSLGDDFVGLPGAALVVGGSGGIGAAIARMLADRGSTVAVTYRSNPVDGAAHRLDVTDAAACRTVIDTVASEHGGLHTLVYAAGPHVPMVHLSKVDPDDFAHQLTQDAVGFFNAVRPALTHLRETRGSIVAVTTAATDRFPVRDGLSAAPKGAVEATVKALASEEGRFGVRVNAVGPGMLTDGMADRLISSGELDDAALEVTRRNIPLRRFGTADDVAEAACFLASARAGFISGHKINVDGGYSV